jgi:hypothetical protein
LTTAQKLYGRTDVVSITVAQTGHVHKKKDKDERIVIECADCAPHLVALGTFKNKPSAPELLTPDEIEQQTVDEKEGSQFATAMAKEWGRAMAQDFRDRKQGIVRGK